MPRRQRTTPRRPAVTGRQSLAERPITAGVTIVAADAGLVPSAADPVVSGCRPGAGRRHRLRSGHQRRIERFRDARIDAAREDLPLAAPVVIAHRRPDAFDHVGLRVDRIQLRRAAPALAPAGRSAGHALRELAIVVLAGHALVHRSSANALRVWRRAWFVVLVYSLARSLPRKSSKVRRTSIARERRPRCAIAPAIRQRMG